MNGIFYVLVWVVANLLSHSGFTVRGFAGPTVGVADRKDYMHLPVEEPGTGLIRAGDERGWSNIY